MKHTGETHYLLSPERVAELYAPFEQGAQEGRRQYGARSIPGSDQSLVWVFWDADWRAQEAFEAQDGVVLLGDLWDPVPPAAVPVLQALADSHHTTRVAEQRTHGK